MGTILTREAWEQVLLELRRNGPITSCPIVAVGAVFESKVSIESTTFQSHVAFDGAIFEEGLELTRCQFVGGLSLSFVDFKNTPVVCRENTFRRLGTSYVQTMQHVAFVSCSVQEELDFEGATGDLRFDNCVVDGRASGRYASLDHLSLTKSSFSDDVDLSDANVTFLRAHGLNLAKAARLGPLSGQTLDLTDLRCENRMSIAYRGERLSLEGAAFSRGGGADVQDAEVNLERLSLGAPFVVSGNRTARISSIHDSDSGLLTLSAIDLQTCMFYGAHGLASVLIEPTCQLPMAPPGRRARRRCVADEHIWRSHHGRRQEDWSKVRSVVDRPGISADQVSLVYRSLRRSFESQSNQPGAADFYYGEMEMRRLDRTTPQMERLLLTLYWASSGYGLRASRSLLALVLMVFIGATALHGFGIPGSPGTGDSLIAAAQSVVPGVSVDRALSNWGDAVDLVMTILGPVFMGLTALAVRNRLRR